MCNSGSELTPLDLEIERTACVIMRAVREATQIQRTLVEEKSLISSDSEEEIIMEDVTPPTIMGDCCIPTNATHVSLGFVPANLVNFNIKYYGLSYPRENQFDRNATCDLWEHQAWLYETTSMC